MPARCLGFVRACRARDLRHVVLGLIVGLVLCIPSAVGSAPGKSDSGRTLCGKEFKSHCSEEGVCLTSCGKLRVKTGADSYHVLKHTCEACPANATTAELPVNLGKDHSCIAQNGSAFCFGSDHVGQRGVGRRVKSASPVTVPLPEEPHQVSSHGADFGCAIIGPSRKVYCWGDAGSGRTGRGTHSKGPLPVSNLPADQKATQITTGDGFGCALLESGKVWCWGVNNLGQIGVGSGASALYNAEMLSLSGVSQITSGGSSSCAVVSGKCWCWGRNIERQLAANSTERFHNQPVEAHLLNMQGNVVHVEMGKLHGCAVVETNATKQSLFCFGFGGHGQLGIGSKPANSPPTIVKHMDNVISIGAAYVHSCAVLKNHSVYCWGSGGDGRLGTGNRDESLLPVQVVGITDALQVSCSFYHTCVMRFGGAISCWGSSQYRKAGSDSDLLVPTTVPSFTAIQVSAGVHATCGLSPTSPATVQCLGRIGPGVVSDSHPLEVRSIGGPVTGIREVKEVCSSYAHSCAVVGSQRNVMCWGDDQSGKNGAQDIAEPSVPHLIPGISGVSQIGCGEFFNCFLLSDGRVKCMGQGAYGQLGNNQQVATPDGETVFALVDGVSKISVGSNHICALLSNSSVACWGRNIHSEVLGDGSREEVSVPTLIPHFEGAAQIACHNSKSCALFTNGTVRCQGYNAHGEFGTPPPEKYSAVKTLSIPGHAIQLAVASNHICILQSVGRVMCSGMNAFGNLGNGGTGDSSTWVYVQHSKIVSSIASGYHSTCAKYADGSDIICWGDNKYGQLGLGTDSAFESVPKSVQGILDVIPEEGTIV